VAAQAVVTRPILPPLPVLADPTFGLETVDPGMGARQTLAWMFRNRGPYAAPVAAEAAVIPPAPVDDAGPCSEMADLAEDTAQALAKLSSFAPPPTMADPPAEALEPVEVAVPLQRSRPKTDFMLPARLAVVAKINAATVRAPRHLPYRLSPGKAVPIASSVRPVRVRHPQRLEAMRPKTRIIVQQRPTPSEIIDLDSVRKALQSSPVAKYAA